MITSVISIIIVSIVISGMSVSKPFAFQSLHYKELNHKSSMLLAVKLITPCCQMTHTSNHKFINVHSAVK